MVSGRGTDRAPHMNMLPVPAFVTLLLPRAVGLNVVVVPTIFAEFLEFAEGGRRGVGSGSRAPAIIRTLGGD